MAFRIPIRVDVFPVPGGPCIRVKPWSETDVHIASICEVLNDVLTYFTNFGGSPTEEIRLLVSFFSSWSLFALYVLSIADVDDDDDDDDEVTSFVRDEIAQKSSQGCRGGVVAMVITRVAPKISCRMGTLQPI